MGRLARVARMAGGVAAGGMLAEGARHLRAEKRLRARDMLLTLPMPGSGGPAGHHARRRHESGAILSMDTGDFCPGNWRIFRGGCGRTPAICPRNSCAKAKSDAYGPDWDATVLRLRDPTPRGRFHRPGPPDRGAGWSEIVPGAVSGVAASIDSDVDNIAALLRASGLLPTGLDIKPLLEDAKRQLWDEADYHKEAEFRRPSEICGFRQDQRFLVPEVSPTSRGVWCSP